MHLSHYYHLVWFNQTDTAARSHALIQFETKIMYTSTSVLLGIGVE